MEDIYGVTWIQQVSDETDKELVTLRPDNEGMDWVKSYGELD